MKKIVFIVSIGLMILSCASTAKSSASSDSAAKKNAADAEAAAAAALAAMNNGGVPPASGSSGTSSTSTQTSSSGTSTSASTSGGMAKTGAKPAWVDDPSSVYSEKENLARVGSDTIQDNADKRALASLTSVFGQSIEAQEKLYSAYSEAERAGKLTISASTSMESSINTSTQLDNLIGASIADRWFDGKTYYSIAVMNNAKAREVYLDVIKSYNDTLNTLTDMEDKYTFDGYARYKLAAVIADTNQKYAQVLRYLGGTPPEGLKNAADYTNEINAIAQRIPIYIEVDELTVAESGTERDVKKRIEDGFKKVLTSKKLQGGVANSRYKLKVYCNLKEVVFPNNTNKFVQYNVDAVLEDTSNGNELIAYKITDREGGTTVERAQEFAVKSLEKKIEDAKGKDGFGKALTDYLESL